MHVSNLLWLNVCAQLFLTIYSFVSIKLLVDWKNENVWDSGFVAEPLSITEREVRENWMTVRFMEFVFKCVGPVSHSTRVLLETIKDVPENIMEIINKDDIAWALLVWFNNVLYWTSIVEEASRKKASGGVKKSRKSGRGRPANSKSKDGDGDEIVKVRPRWTGRKKPVSGEAGYSKEGIEFYENMRAVFKKIPTDEWKGVWQEYWDVEKSKHIKQGRRKETAWAKGNEDDSDDSALDLLSDSSDDEEDAGDKESRVNELADIPATGV